MYAFIAAACLENLTKMRTASSDAGASVVGCSKMVTPSTSPYLEHSSPISPESSSSTSPGPTML